MKTIDSIKRFIPFSNRNEAIMWAGRNCDICKYYQCYVRRMFEQGFSTSEITLNRAEWIGLNNNKLKTRCEKFTNKHNRKIFVNSTSKEYDDNFIYNMF